MLPCHQARHRAIGVQKLQGARCCTKVVAHCFLNHSFLFRTCIHRWSSMVIAKPHIFFLCLSPFVPACFLLFHDTQHTLLYRVTSSLVSTVIPSTIQDATRSTQHSQQPPRPSRDTSPCCLLPQPQGLSLLYPSLPRLVPRICTLCLAHRRL